MSGVQVSAAGRMDQEGIRAVQVHPEPMQNPNAAPSPDMGAYEAYPERCRAMTSAGTRCKGLGIPRQNMRCMVHCEKESADEAE